MGADVKGYLKNKKGQAAIEMALSMPLLIWLTYYTINAFFTIHTNHVAQKYAAMNVYQRIQNRSKFAIDDVQNTVVNRSYIAVQYTEPEGGVPLRKIIIGPIRVDNSAGICREPDCN